MWRRGCRLPGCNSHRNGGKGSPEYPAAALQHSHSPQRTFQLAPAAFRLKRVVAQRKKRGEKKHIKLLCNLSHLGSFASWSIDQIQQQPTSHHHYPPYARSPWRSPCHALCHFPSTAHLPHQCCTLPGPSRRGANIEGTS